MKKIVLCLLISSLVFLLSPLNAQTFTRQVNQIQKYSPEAATLYQEAQGALRMRRLTVARQKFQLIIKDYPDDAYASLSARSLAQILRDLNENEEAMLLLKNILAKNDAADNKSFARPMLLDILFDLQRFREGVDLIEAWRKTTPNDIWLERQLARFYLQTGRKDEAWMLLETMLERTASPAIFRDLLELSLKSGEVEKLLKTLEDRRNRFKSRDYSNFVADCYLALDRKDKAIEAIKETPDLNREWMLLKKLAQLQIETGDVASAYQTLQQIDSMVRDDWDTLKKMGHCLVLLKRQPEAVKVWQRPFIQPRFQRQEQYLNYTTVLIEHQMYEEALTGFREARKRLGNPTLFAEEVATVLEALGRRTEALDEYIQVFRNGTFKLQIFDKLYSSSEEGFDLESRLREQLKVSFSVAIRQALIELYFRTADGVGVKKIVQLINSSGGNLDDFFFERLNQEATIYAGNFHFNLCGQLLKTRPESTLALKIASLMLEMAVIEPIYGESAFTTAFSLVKSKKTVDAELKAKLLIELASFAFEKQRKPKLAHELLDKILQSELLRAVPKLGVEAAIQKAHIMVYEENYAQAESLLQENHKNVKSAQENIFAANPIGEEDYLALILLEQALSAANQGDFQKTLDLLKGIIENFPESVWANDSLQQALFITRTSVGDFSLIKNILRARRLSATGRNKEASEQYQAAIVANASLTAMITEFKAEEILNSQFYLSDKEVLKKIREFKKEHKQHYMTADLIELELYYLRRAKANEAEIRELLQKFVDIFPADLRSGRYKKLLDKNKLLLIIPKKEAAEKEEAGEENLLPELPDMDQGMNLEDVAPDSIIIDLDELGDY